MNPRQRQIAWALIGVLVGSLVMVLVGSAAQTNLTVATIREAQEANLLVRDQQSKVLRAVRSCTTPGRMCFERGQRQYADAIARINEVTVLAAVCAANLDQPTVKAIQTCIDDQLVLVRKGTNP